MLTPTALTLFSDLPETGPSVLIPLGAGRLTAESLLDPSSVLSSAFRLRCFVRPAFENAPPRAASDDDLAGVFAADKLPAWVGLRAAFSPAAGASHKPGLVRQAAIKHPADFAGLDTTFELRVAGGIMAGVGGGGGGGLVVLEMSGKHLVAARADRFDGPGNATGVLRGLYVQAETRLDCLRWVAALNALTSQA